MPIQRSTAKKLVSESEFKLINESFPPLVGELSDKALLQRMERARKTRDRYHAMVERQRGKASTGAQRSGQRGAAPSANLKESISKEKIFEETLARFERRNAKAGGSAGPQAATQMKSAMKSAGKAASSGKSAAGGSPKQSSLDKAKAKAKAVAAKSAGMKGGVNTPAQDWEGKKSPKYGAEGVSKASVKMANKAAAKSGAKPVPKAGKGKGGATKRVPRGRHGAAVASTTVL